MISVGMVLAFDLKIVSFLLCSAESRLVLVLLRSRPPLFYQINRREIKGERMHVKQKNRATISREFPVVEISRLETDR